MINDIFKYYPLTPNNIIDVFMEIDFSDIIESETKYDVYIPTSTDNLMLISKKFYNTIDDWWIIFEFNKMYDVLFGVIPKKVINIIVSELKDKIINYDNLSTKDKLQIEEIVRFYYVHSNDITTAIKKSLDTLNDPLKRSSPNFLMDFDYIITTAIIDDNLGFEKIKIPSSTTVMKMKQKMKSQLKEMNKLNT